MYLLTDWVRRINFDKLREERQNTLQEKIGKKIQGAVREILAECGIRAE